MLIMTGPGTDLFFLLFALPFILPLIIKVLSGFALAFSGGNSANSGQVRPSGQKLANSTDIFNAAKRDFPAQLIDLDNELTLAEEFGTDLNADELKAARGRLNEAFSAYAKNFGDGIDAGTGNVRLARKTVADNLAAATRHLGLADPNSPLHNEPAPAPAAEASAPPADSIEDELYRRFGVERGAQADAPSVGQRPAQARRGSVMVTPFGLMIGF